MQLEFFTRRLDPVIALIFIAILDVFLFLIVGAWTVGGGEIMMTGIMAKAVLGDGLTRIDYWSRAFVPDPWNWKIYSSLGLVLGGFAGALASGQFSIKLPRRREFFMAAAGGLMMGVGIQLAFVCNVGALFALVPQGHLGGYITALGLLLGAYLGCQIFKRIVRLP